MATDYSQLRELESAFTEATQAVPFNKDRVAKAWNEYNNALHKAAPGLLDELDRLREQERWIPVAERLPELSPTHAEGDCPTSLIVWATDGAESWEAACHLDDWENPLLGGAIEQAWKGQWFDAHSGNYLHHVLAWRPLPAAYQLEGDKTQ